MGRPFFSICIPNYNYARYIGRTLESVLAQDEDDLELIVADNASTDPSVDVVRAFAEKDARVKLIQNKYNVGFAPNLEKAARPALGRFMLLLSSDDVLLPGALSHYRAIIRALGKRAESSVISARTRIIDAHDVTIGSHSMPSWYPMKHDVDLAELCSQTAKGHEVLALALKWLSNPFSFCTTLYSRKLYEAVEGYNATWTISPDLHFGLKLLSCDPTVVYCDKELAGWRAHGNNQGQQQGMDQNIKLEFDRYQLLLEYGQDRAGRLGVDHDEMRRHFVEFLCLNRAARYVSQGHWVAGFRRFCLAWALEPAMTAYNLRTPAVAALLALGPLGALVARGAITLRGERSHAPSP